MQEKQTLLTKLYKLYIERGLVAVFSRLGKTMRVIDFFSFINWCIYFLLLMKIIPTGIQELRALRGGRWANKRNPFPLSNRLVHIDHCQGRHQGGMGDTCVWGPAQQGVLRLPVLPRGLPVGPIASNFIFQQNGSWRSPFLCGGNGRG